MEWSDFSEMKMGTIFSDHDLVIEDDKRTMNVKGVLSTLYIKPNWRKHNLEGQVIALEQGYLKNGRRIEKGDIVHVSHLRCFETGR